MLNQFNFMGRATADSEIRYTEGDNPLAIARFTLAVSRNKGKDGQIKSDFFRIVAYGKTAEMVNKYIKKGIKIIVTGHVVNNNYQDKDGNMHYNVDFVASMIYFCEKKADNEAVPEAAPVTDADGFMNIPDNIDEELPFA